MSRSRRYTPICGNGGGSEKYHKRVGNRRLRKRSKQMIQSGDYDNCFPIMDEVMNKWCMTKDGKGWFGELKDYTGPFWEGYYDKLMRK